MALRFTRYTAQKRPWQNNTIVGLVTVEDRIGMKFTLSLLTTCLSQAHLYYMQFCASCGTSSRRVATPGLDVAANKPFYDNGEMLPVT